MPQWTRILTCAAGGAVLCARAAAQPPLSADPFPGDARLETRITLARQDPPLRELLPTLGRQLRVPLRASGSIADDKVTLFLDDRPAAEALALVARHFGGVWRRWGDGYELGQSVAGRRQEVTLRTRDDQQQLAVLHGEMERAAQIPETPPERLEQRAQGIRALESEGMEPEQRARLHAERLALHPGRAPAVVVYRALTPGQLREIVAGRELWLSSADGTLSPALAAQVRRAELDATKLWGALFRFLGAERWPPPQTAVVVRLYDTLREQVGPPARGEPHRRLQFIVPLGPEGNRTWSGLVGWSAEAPLPQPPPMDEAERHATERDDPVLQRIVALTLRRPPAPGSERTRPEESASSAWPAGWATLGEVAEALHQATGLEVVADSFTRARLDPRRLADRRPVVEILDRLAEELAYSWRRDGSVLCLRSRRWYRDRTEEVPERLLRPWRQRVGRAGAATLDDLAALASSLTDAQIRGLHQYWGWYFAQPPIPPPGADAGGFYAACPHLRFWSSLSLLQRRAALAGAPLPVARMSLGQRQAFAAALLAPAGSSSDPNELHPLPAPAEIATGTFRLTTAPSVSSVRFTFAYHVAGEPRPAREFDTGLDYPPGATKSP
jgi:hypothetical protein